MWRIAQFTGLWVTSPERQTAAIELQLQVESSFDNVLIMFYGSISSASARHLQPHMSFSLIIERFAAVLRACNVALLVVLTAPNLARARDSNSPPQAKVVPITLGALPHSAWPRGAFKAWCGLKDRFLLDVDGQLEAFDGNVKSAMIAVSSSWPLNCSDDGKQLVYVDTHTGYVTKVDIASGVSRLIGSYQVPHNNDAHVSFSGDLQSVATDEPLQLAADAGNLKVITVKKSDDQIRAIKWSSDSSKFIVIHFQTIEVFDAKGSKIVAGSVPKGTFVQDGWFDPSQQTVILHLRLDTDESGPGAMTKCRVAGWSCDRIKPPRVDSVAVGGRGLVGTVFPLGRIEPSDEGSVVTYPQYAVEIRDAASALLVRQVYRTASGQSSFKIYVAPSATKAILTWEAKATAECGRPDSSSSYCNQGMLVDLSKVVK